MVIIQATNKDYRSLVNSINRGKKIDYITANHLKQDLLNNELYILKLNDKNAAIFTITFDEKYNHWYLKRLKVLNAKNLGKGILTKIIEWVAQLDKKIAITPWVDNVAVRKTVEKFGFELRYVFNEKWCYYVG